MSKQKVNLFDIYLQSHPKREISFEQFLKKHSDVVSKKRTKRKKDISSQNSKKSTNLNPQFSNVRKFAERPFVPYVRGMKSDFYDTREWRRIRAIVLMKSDKHCAMCGAGREHGVVLHVDHIKPRSKFPSLELVESNLQVLCEECNIGKGALIY